MYVRHTLLKRTDELSIVCIESMLTGMYLYLFVLTIRLVGQGSIDRFGWQIAKAITCKPLQTFAEGSCTRTQLLGLQ